MFKPSSGMADTCAPKKASSFLEAKYRHLPINHFHGGLQKVKRKVDGFTEQIRGVIFYERS
jgi:hypothetical protein